MKHAYLVAGMVAMLGATAGTAVPEFSAPRAITKGPAEHLFASYFGIDSWSPDGRYASVLQTEIRNRLPTENDPAVLGLVDLQDGDRFIPLTETRCWNFQEGTMAHWLDNTSLIYNDTVEGKFASIVLDINTRAKRVVPFPIAAVAPDGRWAIGINYARLRLTRADYGYGGPGQDARKTETWPDDDGLWLIDLATGEAKLTVSIASVRERMPDATAPNALSYFCHVKISPDSRRVFWLARTVGEGPLKTTAFVCDRDGGNIVRCFPDGWGGSHFNWLDATRLYVSANYGAAVMSHVLFTVGQDDYTRMGKGLLDFDGHGVFSPGGRWMVTDTYPDAKNERKMMVLDMASEQVHPLGAYAVPAPYDGPWPYWRCDLHPRWRADGRMLGINSVHEGTRQVYVFDVKGI